MDFTDLLGDLGGFYRDIEVAKQSSNGVSDLQSRPESVPDQNSVGVPSPAGPNNNINVLGMQMNGTILIVTVVVIGGLLLLRRSR